MIALSPVPTPLDVLSSPTGLGFRPRPPPEKVESTLIWFTSGEGGNWGHWVNNLDEYLKRKYLTAAPDALELV